VRYVTFKSASDQSAGWRIGAWLGEHIGDLAVASTLFCKERREHLPHVFEGRFPSGLLDLLRLEKPGLDFSKQIVEWLGDSSRKELRAIGPEGHPLFWPVQACTFDVPLRPGKLITLARNYHEHVAEHGLTNSGKVPSASIKASSSLAGPYADIVRPAAESELDYETELALVIGTRCKHVPEKDAYGVIGGYTVLSDIVARQVLKIERAAGNQFLGKMFDTFGPLGPGVVTSDEIGDPMNLHIETRVNGEVRQHSNTSKMIWTIPQLVAYFSQATLEVGDVISTGTPAGVAAGRKPGETPWYLNPGDVIESEVEHIGMLRNRVVQEKPHAATWDWNR
jgi:2-keto-4-pentenoate hydratase/2-oxohepta-3-ene-1,7-dioic acid hydratase in catechol pathway